MFTIRITQALSGLENKSGGSLDNIGRVGKQSGPYRAKKVVD